MSERKKQKGFTFVEVLAVVVLLGILVTVAVPIVSKYVGKGKDDYNEKLNGLLELAGKSYFSDNRKLLPVKQSKYVDKIATSYVLAPTLQTNNYLTKELVDSDGRNCQKSYVFVRQDENTTKNKYHACLICEDKNYSENDEYCKITDFTISEPPTCKKVVISSYKRYDNVNYYNPDVVRLEGIETDKLSSIVILNTTTGTKKVIDLSKTKIDVSLTNLVDYFPKKGLSIENGKYSITILDKGANESKCINNIVFDNQNPTCELTLNNGKLYITPSDNYTKSENINTLINTKNSSSSAELKDKFSDPISVSNGTYYGHVMDEAGNIGKCFKIINNTTPEEPIPDPTPTPDPEPDPSPVPDPTPTPTPDPTPNPPAGSPPYCYFSKNSPTGWLKAGSSTTLEITCKSQGTKTAVTKSNLSTTKSLGTLSSAKKSSNYVYKTTYTPKNNKTGTDKVKIGAGFIKDSYGSSSSVLSNDLKIDTVKPDVKITFSGTKKDGFYVKGVEVTLKCTDKGSGVKNVKLNTKESNSSSVTVKNTKVGESISYTGTCWDKAGNSESVTEKINVKEYSADKDCGCKQNVTCKTYKSCQTSACGCKTYSRCSKCDCATYSSWSKTGSTLHCSKCVGSGTGKRPSSGCKADPGRYFYKATCTGGKYVKCTTGVAGGQYTSKYCETQTTYSRSCNKRERCSSCSCETYKSCRKSACGCETWNSCTSYKSCYHY